MALISKIVSGGQTGVDRAALDAAIFLEIEHGGYCPAGRRAEDGPIPPIYRLSETEKRSYSVRTELNVVNSDATLILYREQMTGGTELTFKLTKKHKRPCFTVNLSSLEFDNSLTDASKQTDDGFLNRRSLKEQVVLWIQSENVGVLNVAGPRESTSPTITKAAESFLIKVFESATPDKT